MKKRPEREHVALGDLTIELVGSLTESDALDALLWEVLWQPLGLPRDIRRSFGLTGDCLELVAKAKGPILGGIVAKRTSASEVEICHIAVRLGFQLQGIGGMLVEYLVEMLEREGCLRVHVIARNTSVPFFRELGFEVAEGTPPEHPGFKKFGISFVLMEKEIKDGCKAAATEWSTVAYGQGSGKGYPGGFHLREFRASDLKQLRQLIHHTIDACYSDLYPPRAVVFFKEYHSEKEIVQRGTDGTIFVSENDGALVATGALVGNEITGVFICPSIQGRGRFGREIIQELERLAWERGYREVELSVSLPSKRFYESLGYEILCDCALDVGEGERLDFWKGRKMLQA